MSNSDRGDRGLATRRGVCAVVCVRAAAQLLLTALRCAALHASALSQSPVLWHDLADGSDLHEAIPLPRLPASSCALDFLSGCKGPESAIREQWRVRPGPWTGLSTTAAGLLPRLERLQSSTASGVLALVTGLWTVPGINSSQRDAVSLPAHGFEMMLSRMTRPLAPGAKSITC